MHVLRVCLCWHVCRLVEGDIFRIGMHLEDIKEMIDKNVCEQISPPHSSSTPTSMKEMLHVKPSALCISTPSSPPSLHEVLADTPPTSPSKSYCYAITSLFDKLKIRHVSNMQYIFNKQYIQ